MDGLLINTSARDRSAQAYTNPSFPGVQCVFSYLLYGVVYRCYVSVRHINRENATTIYRLLSRVGRDLAEISKARRWVCLTKIDALGLRVGSREQGAGIV